MYDINIYNEYVISNGVTYSIDKMRLKTYITYVKFQDLIDYINIFYKDNVKKIWTSSRKMCFHYNYLIDFSDFSFYFAFMHNSEGVDFYASDKKYNFTIEFNPNKCKDNKLLRHILNIFYDWFLRSFDLAIDIPVSILDILFDTGRRRKLQTISYGGDNITYNFRFWRW